MPQFFADECFAGPIVGGLRDLGFDIRNAKDVCKGDGDDKALSVAATLGRVLITEDWGFGG